MHPAARTWVDAYAWMADGTVLEFGSRDVNGGIRDLFTTAQHVGVDITDGPGVDVVADAATYTHPERVGTVVCCEVLEHTPDWRLIVANMADSLLPGGLLIITAAADPRLPHSAVDGNEVRPGEWYQNVDPEELVGLLSGFRCARVVHDKEAGDVRAVAVR